MYIRLIIYFQNGGISALPYLTAWLLSFVFSWCSDFALKKGAGLGTIRKFMNSIAHWGPGLALLGLCFVPAGSDNKVIPVLILVLAVGLNSAVFSGFQANHIDLSPNYAGTMMSITNCIAAIVAIITPIIVGKIVEKEVYRAI